MRSCLSILLFVAGLLVAGLRSLPVAAQEHHAALVITPLVGSFYVYTTWGMTGGMPFPANGLYLVTAERVVVIDSP